MERPPGTLTRQIGFAALAALAFGLGARPNVMAAGNPTELPAHGNAPPTAFDDRVGSDCKLNGHQLYGKVQVVEHFPDLKVKVVQHFPDLKVKAVEHFPDKCGRWQFVENFPDFKIQYVEHFPDLEIQMVDHFPGVP
jgi:hypothetical protein